jgi:hypothetical protein
MIIENDRPALRPTHFMRREIQKQDWLYCVCQLTKFSNISYAKMAYCMIMLQGLSFFAENSIMTNIYQDRFQLFVSPQTDDTENKKKAKFCFNKTVLHPTSVMRCVM